MPATRARLNTLLKSHSLISAGFEFPVRHGSRMAGQPLVLGAGAGGLPDRGVDPADGLRYPARRLR